MNNNDILRRVRYILDLNDSKMMKLFALGDQEVTRAQISDWLKKDDDPAFQELTDHQLAIYLNGLIIDQRGKKDGPPAIAETTLNNNIVFRKLKIAFNLKAEDILATFKLTGKSLGEHELSAFFRNPKQSQYRPCNDQYLRGFLNGLQIKHRGKTEE